MTKIYSLIYNALYDHICESKLIRTSRHFTLAMMLGKSENHKTWAHATVDTNLCAQMGLTLNQSKKDDVTIAIRID